MQEPFVPRNKKLYVPAKPEAAYDSRDFGNRRDDNRGFRGDRKTRGHHEHKKSSKPKPWSHDDYLASKIGSVFAVWDDNGDRSYIELLNVDRFTLLVNILETTNFTNFFRAYGNKPRLVFKHALIGMQLIAAGRVFDDAESKTAFEEQAANDVVADPEAAAA